ncbi:MAG TPA: D-alanine--D-alanine ligase [Lentimicrobium sp.]|nr:D-alanine--D-alanine ligase [Lentimicrobium sp.]
MKKNVALLSGGYSKEYEVSVSSGKVICENLDPELFNVYQIHINADRWLYLEGSTPVEIDKNDFSLTLGSLKIRFDCAFIGIHGTPGEDGKLQGYLDMMRIPYSTCGRTTSALTFNKYFTNELIGRWGFNVANTYYLHRRDKINTHEIIKLTGLPCFVKPNCNGSSVGISKVHELDELLPALDKAFSEDDEVLIQEFIPGIEVTCGVFEKDQQPIALPLTEIITANEFFDYQAKYTKGYSDEITPARISDEQAKQCTEISLELYRKLNCRGIVRFDYILTPKNEIREQQFYILEVNTIPGLSEASIVPKQAASAGISLKELFTHVVNETLNYYKNLV